MRKTLICLLALLLAACNGQDDAAGGSPAGGNWWDSLPREEWSAFRKIEQSQDWFEVYEVADGVYAIYEPGQFEEVISYLITGSDRALLFDTGLGIGDMRQVVSELTDLDVTVLNSHAHYDHIGGNYQFENILATNSTFMRQRSSGSKPEDVAGLFAEGRIWKELPADINPADFRSEPFTIARTVDNGEQIDLGGRTIEVVRVPGHSPDSICILDRENRMIFTGDTFYLAPLYAHLPESDFLQYVESAEHLASLSHDYDRVHPGHNVAGVDERYLVAMAAAFRAIQRDPSANFTLRDGNRRYSFDGFSIIVADDQFD